MVSELANLVRSLYSQLLLRDVFGKMVPGAVVLVGIGCAIWGASPVRVVDWLGRQPTIVILGLLAISWTVGFVPQKLSRLVAKEESNLDAAMAEEAEAMQLFGEPQLQANERSIVIKEACGNLAAALVLLGLLWAFGHVLWPPANLQPVTTTQPADRWLPLARSGIVGAVVVMALWCQRLESSNRQAAYRKLMLKEARKHKPT